MSKIIDEAVFKRATEKILQVLADNVYEEIPYQDYEIENLFDGTPEDIDYYSSLISDTLVSENRIFSSRHVTDLLQQLQLDCNSYADEIAIRNLTTEIVSSTSEVIKENVLYLILSDSSTNTYEQYMLIKGTATPLGSTQIELSQYYNKSEINTKLADKANKNEVLAIDDVQTATGSETNDTVYSSKLTKDELDKKVNVTDISNTIDENSTDDTIPTSKAVYDLIEQVRRLAFLQNKLLLTYTFTTGYPVVPQLNNDSSYEYTFEDMDNGDGTTTRNLYGTVPITKINFYADTNHKYLISLDGTANIKLTDTANMFKDCTSLTSINFNNIDTSNVTNMGSMFHGCNTLTSVNLANIDTSNVTNMGYMFYGCKALTSVNLSGLNTSNVTSMSSMFYDCNKLTSVDVSNFNTSKVTNMFAMFFNCNKLTSLNLSNFDTAKVTNMGHMFGICSELTTLRLDNFSSASLTSCSNMLLNIPSSCSIYRNATLFTKTETETGFVGTFKNV